jgi:hypothetical protein
MQGVLQLAPSEPFDAPSALRAFLYPQGSTGTFPSRPSEVDIPVHDPYTMFGAHLPVS